MNLKCDLCSYSARDKFDLKKHLNTKKHLEKVIISPNDSHPIPTIFMLGSNKNKEKMSMLPNKTQNILHICKHCNNNFSSVSNLSRHNKSCFIIKYALIMNSVF